MAVIRLEALRQLAAKIRCEVAEFVSACIGQADPSRRETFPSLSIQPGPWIYNPHQADEHHDPAPDRVVMNVGYHEGTIELRIGAATSYQRALLEQKVLDVFLGTPLKPGVLLTPVLACPALGDFTAAWTLEEDRWIEEFAFDNDWYSQISVIGVVPALVTRKNSHTIEQLQLGLTEDFGVAVDENTFNTTQGIEVVQVNQDGTISPVP